MTTRYSLPARSDSADTARSARTLAALVLVVFVLGLCLLVAFMPEADAPLAASPDAEAAPQPQPTPLGA